MGKLSLYPWTMLEIPIADALKFLCKSCGEKEKVGEFGW